MPDKSAPPPETALGAASGPLESEPSKPIPAVRIASVQYNTRESARTLIEAKDCDAIFATFKARPNNVTINTLLERDLAGRPYDLAVLRDPRNHPLLTADLFKEIVLVGAHDAVAESSGRNYCFYGGHLGSAGNFAQTLNVYFTEPPSTVLEAGLMKIPEPEKEKLGAFLYEAHIADRIEEVIAKHPQHPGIKHIVKTLFLNNKFIVMPKIKNPSGKSQTLLELAKSGKGKKAFFKNLGDVALAYDLLAEEKIIPVDGSPNNMLCGETGGVVIDFGGFIDIADVGEKRIVRVCHEAKKPDEKFLGLYNSLTGTVQQIGQSPSFTDKALSIQEAKGELPPDLSAKLSLATAIAYFLQQEEMIDPRFLYDFSRLDYGEKAEYDPPYFSVDEGHASPQRDLYELLVKLFQARLHPYPLKASKPDPDYISLQVASQKLYQISEQWN